MFERCTRDAATTGRDESADALKKRINNFEENNQPVIEYYDKFGKVRTIDSNGDDTGAIYQNSKEAILPQVMFTLGPKASGKSTIAAEVSYRSCMQHLKFKDYLVEHSLQEETDDEKCMHLINYLAFGLSNRVILEDFPQNLY